MGYGSPRVKFAHATSLMLAIVLALASAPTSAQTPSSGAPQLPTIVVNGSVYSGRENATAVQIPRGDPETKVDGILDEPMWQKAALLTGFSQYQPVDGRAADDSTEVLIWYSADAIHIGVRAFEAHGAVHATLADRDKIAGDDYVQILLDTFNDHRRAFVFGVNPLGVQSDGTLTEGLQVRASGATAGFGSAPQVRDTVDLSADFVYQSKGHVTPTGFDVEVRIPFKTIPYQSRRTQTWGINVVRHVQHSGYEDTWTPVRRANASFLVQSGTLVGLTDLHRGLVLDLTPVTTSKVNGLRDLSNKAWKYEADNPQLGGNVRWGISNNLTMNGTIKPDFSQVESDVTQVALDPRSLTFYPEKRPFFLDGIEQFETSNTLIYTRAVAAPIAAAKFTGKAAGFNVGLLSAVDEQAESLTGNHNPVFNILRAKRDVGGASTIGMVYTDREDGAGFNRVGEVDGRIVFAKIYNITFQAAGSATQHGDSTHWAPLWEGNFDRTGRSFRIHYTLRGIHPDFRAESGFIRRGDMAYGDLEHRYTWFGQPGALIESLTHSMTLDGTAHYRGLTENHRFDDIRWHNTSNLTFRGGWKTGFAIYLESYKYDPTLFKGYALLGKTAAGRDTILPFTGVNRIRNIDWVANLTTPQWAKFDGNISLIFGPDDNFFEWSPVFVWLPTINFNWRPTERIRVAGRYVLQQYTRGGDRTTVQNRQIPRLKVEYQLSRPIFLRWVGQYDTNHIDALRDDDNTNFPIVILNNNGGYTPTVVHNTNNFRMDWLFSYQPNPGTVLFVGYGTTLNELNRYQFSDLTRSTDGFFVKLSYLFRM
jgi:hypothetical protein